VRTEATRRIAAGLFTRRSRRAAVVTARHSTCGRPNATRCCVYDAPDDATGRCRVVHVVACAAAFGTNAGPGSCAPSTCAR
jgi:hypothetical protein